MKPAFTEGPMHAREPRRQSSSARAVGKHARQLGKHARPVGQHTLTSEAVSLPIPGLIVRLPDLKPWS
jgi:hypothetical protein